MKYLLTILICLSFTALPAAAGSRDAAYGALMGAAVGAIVGHNSGSLSSEAAIPAFAALGALLGYGYDRDWYDDDAYWYYDPWDYDWYDDHHRGWRYRPQRYRVKKPRLRQPVVAPRASGARHAAAAAPNLHPGVEIVIVPVALGNGVSIDLRIMKVNDRFIGPQGEEYDSLPTADVLAEQYRP